MARMIDLIRQSAVPSNVMRSASKGALTLPAGEVIEILVYLTTNPVFAKDAAMTLAGWDEKSCLQVLADPQTPFEVTNYFLDAKNRRPKLLPAPIEEEAAAPVAEGPSQYEIENAAAIAAEEAAGKHFELMGPIEGQGPEAAAPAEVTPAEAQATIAAAMPPGEAALAAAASAAAP